MRLLHSVPFSQGSLTFFLPAGSYAGFQIAFRGTNDNVAAKTRADLGNVNLTWDGSPIINVDAELISYLNDLKGGFSTFVSTINSTLNAQLFVPAGQFDDKNNAYLITDRTKVYFKLDFPNLMALTGNVYIYGVNKVGVHNYFYCLTSRNVTSGGAGTLSDLHRLSNVSAIYLKTTSIIDSIQITRDNKILIDGLRQDIQAFSDRNNQVEASNTIIELDMNLSRNIKEIVSQEILFKYQFNSSGLLQQYFAYSVLTPSQAVQSVNLIKTELQSKVNTGIIKNPPQIVGISQDVPNFAD